MAQPITLDPRCTARTIELAGYIETAVGWAKDQGIRPLHGGWIRHQHNSANVSHCCPLGAMVVRDETAKPRGTYLTGGLAHSRVLRILGASDFWIRGFMGGFDSKFDTEATVEANPLTERSQGWLAGYYLRQLWK